MIWHLVPAHVLAQSSQGSFKDVSGREAMLQNLGKRYRRIVIRDDLPEEVLAHLEEGAPSHVLIEYSCFPKILAALRKRIPAAVLAIRAHNIEPLQHLGNHGLANVMRIPWVLYGAVRLFAADLTCRRLAHVVFPISEWEAERYWKFLPGKARVEWLPYVTPESLIPRTAQGRERRSVVCLPTSHKNRKSVDLVQRFLQFAAAGTAHGCRYRFALTGDLASWGLDIPDRVEVTGMISDLQGFMAGVKAVAILSPRGYGFKTTLMDAIASGAFVLLHPTLYRRCPAVLRPACIAVESDNREEIVRALAAIDREYPLHGANQALRTRTEQLVAGFVGSSGLGS